MAGLVPAIHVFLFLSTSRFYKKFVDALHFGRA
jgi:hypothetical protein